jgi:hypothetical protein
MRPGRGSLASPGLEGYFFLAFLAFFTVFFAFFAFLAIVSSQGFHGMKRDTRDARRRASLATSSNVIPADSQGAAPCCHARVIALSTVVVRFRGDFGRKSVPRDIGFDVRRTLPQQSIQIFTNSKPRP